MRKAPFRRISPAFVLAFVALILAMSGGAVAASKITGKQIASGTITGKNVKDRSLTGRDFSGSLRGPRGPQGPQGLQGPQGPQGPSVVGQMTVVNSGQVAYGPSDVIQTAVAFCPAGQRAISGGGANIGDQELWLSEATPGRSGWVVGGADLTDDGGEYIRASAACAPVGAAVAARATSRASVRRWVARLEAARAAQLKR